MPIDAATLTRSLRSALWPDRVRPVVAALGTAGIVAGLVAVVARHVHSPSRLVIVAGAAAPYLALAALVGTVLAVIARHWVLATTGIVLVTVTAVGIVPLYVGASGVDGPHVTMRVLSSNLLYGRADAEQLVELIRTEDIDVFAVQELTTQAVERLDTAGLAELLPYRIVDPRRNAGGTGLFARFPLTPIDVPSIWRNAQIAATMSVTRDNRMVTTTIASLHPTSPWPSSGAAWSRELDQLAAWSRTLSGPVILAGDFNATVDIAGFRSILDGGYADGATTTGAGYLPTYPSDRAFPPLFAIDHVLTRGGPRVASVHTITIRGSDHRAVVATVDLPTP